MSLQQQELNSRIPDLRDSRCEQLRGASTAAAFDCDLRLGGILRGLAGLAGQEAAAS